jgi:hypothetical protein
LKCYRIRDWDIHFENNRTKELKTLTWIPVPNKHDGDGFTELMSHKDAMQHYGAWHLIVQVASKCDPRGTLMREGQKPHDSSSLARITRGSKKVFDSAIPRLISIGWLEVYETNGSAPHEGAASPQEGAALQKGMEGNRMEGKDIIPPSCSGKKPYGELGNVRLSDEEHAKLVAGHGEAKTTSAIEILDGYIGTKKRDPYANHYAALKEGSWVWERVEAKSKTAEPWRQA